MSRFAVGLAFVLTLLFALSASAQTGDVVRLADGSFFRGTIVESSPERVVIALPNGESRTFPRADVISAGPEAAPQAIIPAAPVVAPPYVPQQPTTRLHATTEDEALSLQRLSGSATVAVSTGRGMAYAQIDQFDVICNLPCDVELPPGAYQFGLAQGTGTAIRTGPPLTLREGDVQLALHYDSREAERIAGWLTWIVGLAGGTALATASVLVDDYGINMPMLISGCVLAVVGIAVGLPLAFLGDHAEAAIVF